MEERPNVMVISTHDSGCHFGCYGVPTVQTPAIDGLAAEGVLFQQMFATSSICSPSRGSLLTGRYPQSNGLIGLAGPGRGCELNDPKQHLSHILHDAGYYTALFGTQHETGDLSTLGFDRMVPDRIERDESFDGEFVVHADDPYATALHYSAINTAEDTAGDVVDFLNAAAADDGPFYIQAGFYETHTPYLWGGCEADESKGVWVPPYVGSCDEEEGAKLKQHIANLQGSLRRVDEAVGTILASLRDNGLEENTIVVFVTDHGPELPGAKWTMYDGGIKIAFMMRWPAGGVTGGRSCDAMLSNIDFVPTLAELIGLTVSEEVEGVSFARTLRNEAEEGEAYRDAVFALNIHGVNRTARTERYKVIHNGKKTCFSRDVLKQDSEMPVIELYDLEKDSLERRNVAQEESYAEVLGEMKVLLWDWLVAVDDPMVREQSQL